MNQSAITPGAPPLQLLSNVGKSTIYEAEFVLTAKEHLLNQPNFQSVNFQKRTLYLLLI
jgi:hypothetical protein